jgi:SPW repeat
MDPHRSTPASAWIGWINVFLGVWVATSPLVLGYGAVRAALWNDLLLGILVIIAGRAAATGEVPAASWANVLFGLWLIASPFVLGYEPAHHPAAAGNNIVFGLVIAGLALMSALFYYPELRPAARRRAPGA